VARIGVHVEIKGHGMVEETAVPDLRRRLTTLAASCAAAGLPLRLDIQPATDPVIEALPAPAIITAPLPAPPDTAARFVAQTPTESVDAIIARRQHPRPVADTKETA
jgi:hypothetical protein